ncbi:MAG: hypothetical protein RLZZ618_908 [Pseudomonadota bacterium]|jgi:hypothetical protein
MFSLRLALLLSLTLGLTACITPMPMRKTLTPENQSKLTEVNAHVYVVQDEVLLKVRPSNASAVSMVAGGGLLGAVIGTSIDSTIINGRVTAGQQLMAPFYATIEDVDYRTEFNDAIKRELASYPVKVSQVTTTPRMLTTTELVNMQAGMPGGRALLVIAPTYHLSVDSRTFDAEVVVAMWTKDSEPNAPIQRAVVYYQSNFVGTGGKDSMEHWSAKNAELFRSMVRESVAETVKMISLSIRKFAEPDSNAEFKAYEFNTGGDQGVVNGRVLQQTDSRVVVLGTNEAIYSIPNVPKAAAVAK